MTPRLVSDIVQMRLACIEAIGMAQSRIAAGVDVQASCLDLEWWQEELARVGGDLPATPPAFLSHRGRTYYLEEGRA